MFADGAGARQNPITPRSAYFAGLLDDFTLNELTAIARAYAKNSVLEHGMFGDYDTTPQTAITDAVGAAVDAQEQAVLKRIDKKLEGLKAGGAAHEEQLEKREQTLQEFAKKRRRYADQAQEAFAKPESSAMRVPRLSSVREVPYETGQGLLYQAERMQFEEHALDPRDAQRAVALVSNRNGIEFIQRLTGRPQDEGGLHHGAVPLSAANAQTLAKSRHTLAYAGLAPTGGVCQASGGGR
jgi:hypothetical protein